MFVKKNLFILVFLSLCHITVFSQNRIEGLVTDSSGIQVLTFASASLLMTKDSGRIATTKTSESGKFFFENLHAGTFLIAVKYLGYSEKITDKLEVNGQKGTLNVPTIKLSPESKKINEVEVVGQRLKGTDLVDRTSYTLNEEIARTAKSGLDLLRRIPSVQLDFQNNITLNGKSNILILVDGREKDANYLQQIDPLSVDRVEVISQPIAKYEGSVSGILNIILKKDKRIGFSGSMNGQLPTSTESFMEGGRLNCEYGFGKFRIYASGGINKQQFSTSNTLTRDSYSKISGSNDSIPERYGSISNGTSKYWGYSSSFGIDYFINDKNLLNFTSRYNHSADNSNSENDRISKIDNALNYNTNTQSNNKNTAGYYSLFYKRLFEKPGHELTVDLTFNKNEGNGNTLNNDVTFADSSRSITKSINSFGTNQTLERNSFKGLIDYSLPITNNYKFETGGQYYLQRISNGSRNFGVDTTTYFDYTETRYAGYAILNGKQGKISEHIGLRTEYAVVQIKNKKPNYFLSYLPNFSMLKQFGDKQSLRLGYTVEVSRPQARDLDPFVKISDSINYTGSRGNPNLSPTYIDHFNLIYSINSKIGFISSEISHERYRNATSGMIIKDTINGRLATLSQSGNICEGRDWSFSLSGNLQPFKWMFINPNFRYTRQHSYTVLEAYKSTFPDRVYWCWAASLYAQFSLPKSISLSTDINFNSPSISGYYDYKSNYFYMVSLDKRLFRNKAHIGISWTLPLSDKYRISNSHYKTSSIEETQLGYLKYNYLVQVNFSYRFRYGKENKRIDRDNSVETDFKGGKL